jgi:catechol 2,3-dioxygenase-like lactoylglutathione lyase family enzyme
MGITRIDNVGLAVRDVRASARYFEEALGFEVELAADGEPPSAVVHVGDQYLYVFQTSDDSSAGQERSPELVGNPPGLDHVSFTVDDVDATYRELRERGVEFKGEPATLEEWGIRTVAFRDPDGNSLFLVQAVEG